MPRKQQLQRQISHRELETRYTCVIFLPCRQFTNDNLQREASLPNADPASDSQTAALVNEQAPFMVKTYVRPPPMFIKGEGVYLWDIENRKYLDFTAGIAVNALGHCEPEIAKLIAQQVRRPL